MERVTLLICDVDGTLLGDELALDEFAAWYARAKGRVRLAYSSGRFISSILQSVAASNLPEPDAVIGGVGTEAYDIVAGKRLPMWPPVSFGWNPHIIREICNSHCELTPQPDRFLSYHKVSFFGRNLDEAFLARLVRQLAAAYQNVSIVYSSDRDLDIVPRDVDKGAAAAFLAKHWKIDPQNVIVAGDSGNDAAMFRKEFRAIVVGNAQPEVRSLTGPHIYQAAAAYAAGVLEGLGHWLHPARAMLLEPVD